MFDSRWAHGALLLLCLFVAPKLAAQEVRAEIVGDDLRIFGPRGTKIRVLDQKEKVVARGRIDRTGALLLAGHGESDPMVQLVDVDGERRALSALFPAVEILAVFPPTVAAGLPIVPHVKVVKRGRGARGVAGIAVEVDLVCGKKRHRLARLTTDHSGVAAGEGRAIPAKASGDCRLEARAAGARLAQVVSVKRGARLVLSADRPVYKPGDTIHVRGVALDLGTSEPLSGARGTLALRDSTGNPLERKTVTTSAFGLADAALAVPGTYRQPTATLLMRVGGVEVTRSVKVGQYVPPAVTVGIEPVRDAFEPGGEVAVSIVVERLDGGPTGGARVELTGRAEGRVAFERKGVADEEGRVLLGGPVPAAGEGLVLSVRAETTGGMGGTGTLTVPIDRGGLRVFAIPESGHAVRGVENGIWVVTLRPDGQPAPSEVRLKAGAARARIQTASDGIGFGRLAIPARAGSLVATARSGDRRGERSLELDRRSMTGVLLHLDRLVADPGETITAELRAPGRSGLAVFDLVREQHATITLSAPIQEGRASVSFPAPAGLAGTLRVHGWTLDGRRVVGDTRLALIRDPRDLSIELNADREIYQPRQEASIAIRVFDGTGAPVQAAIGLVAVDKGLLALGLEQPGIEQALARMGDAWDETIFPLPDWTREALYRARDRRKLAVLASAAAAETRLRPAAETEASRMRAASTAFRPAIVRRAKGVAKAFGRWYARRRHKDRRVKASKLVARKVLAASQLRDPWGRAIVVTLELGSCCRTHVKLVSHGVDGRAGTGDDIEVLEEFEGYHTRACRCASFAMGRAGLGARGVGFGGGGAMSSISVRRLATLRTEFPDTLAVEPALVTDASGRATWTVRLADSLTTWLVQARAISRRGGLGGAVAELRVEQPFSASAQLPPSLVSGDVFGVPIEITNRTGSSRTLTVQGRATGALAGELSREIEVGARSTGVVVLEVRAEAAGEGVVEVEAAGANVADALRRKLIVEPGGVPVSETWSGSVRAGQTAELAFAVPSGGIPGTRAVNLRLYPSSLGAVVEGLDALIAMPSGCFEQTSSTTYPNALVLDYLRSSGRGSPEIEAKARGFLEAGWKRLVDYEVPGGGFSWFGSAPANKILTAFGVMEFERIGRVMKVDPAVARRTRAWLLAQREEDGSWKPDGEYLHAESWSQIQNSNLPVTAYIVWSLATTGASKKDVRSSVRWLRDHAAEAGDPYVQALVALALSTASPRHASAVAARDRLIVSGESVDEGRRWVPKVQTHTYSGGESGTIETTALASLALLAGGANDGQAQEALDWLLASRQPGGGWWTTQSTVLSLETLLRAEAMSGRPASGVVSLYEHDARVGRAQVTPADFDIVRTLSLDTTQGDRRARLRLGGEGALRYQLSAVRRVPASEAPETSAPLRLTVKPDRREVERDDRISVKVRLEAQGEAAVRMPTAEIGIPAGFELDEAALEAPGFAKHEVLGQRIVLYGERLEAGAALEATLPLVARRTAKTGFGTCRAWPYYEPDRSHWIEAGTLTAAAPEL